MEDLLRVFAAMLGGASFSFGVIVAREWIKRLDGYGRLAAQIFVAVHLSVVLFVWGILAERVGEPISWYTPAAVFIFTLKISNLLLVYRLQREQAVRDEPPNRRAGDKA